MLSCMKAQVLSEFIIILACVMIVLIVFVAIYSGQITNLIQSKDTLTAKKIAYQLSGVINNVYLAGDGTAYDITIIRSNENISISKNNLIVTKGGVKVSMPLITENINTSEIIGNRLSIKNNAGLIEIAPT